MRTPGRRRRRTIIMGENTVHMEQPQRRRSMASLHYRMHTASSKYKQIPSSKTIFQRNAKKTGGTQLFLKRKQSHGPPSSSTSKSLRMPSLLPLSTLSSFQQQHNPFSPSSSSSSVEAITSMKNATTKRSDHHQGVQSSKCSSIRHSMRSSPRKTTKKKAKSKHRINLELEKYKDGIHRDVYIKEEEEENSVSSEDTVDFKGISSSLLYPPPQCLDYNPSLINKMQSPIHDVMATKHTSVKKGKENIRKSKARSSLSSSVRNATTQTRKQQTHKREKIPITVKQVDYCENDQYSNNRAAQNNTERETLPSTSPITTTNCSNVLQQSTIVCNDTQNIVQESICTEIGISPNRSPIRCANVKAKQTAPSSTMKEERIENAVNDENNKETNASDAFASIIKDINDSLKAMEHTRNIMYHKRDEKARENARAQRQATMLHILARMEDEDMLNTQRMLSLDYQVFKMTRELESRRKMKNTYNTKMTATWATKKAELQSSDPLSSASAQALAHTTTIINNENTEIETQTLNEEKEKHKVENEVEKKKDETKENVVGDDVDVNDETVTTKKENTQTKQLSPIENKSSSIIRNKMQTVATPDAVEIHIASNMNRHEEEQKILSSCSFPSPSTHQHFHTQDISPRNINKNNGDEDHEGEETTDSKPIQTDTMKSNSMASTKHDVHTEVCQTPPSRSTLGRNPLILTNEDPLMIRKTPPQESANQNVHGRRPHAEVEISPNVSYEGGGYARILRYEEESAREIFRKTFWF